LGKFNNINHNVSRGVACRPVVSPGKWKVGWKIWATSRERRQSEPRQVEGVLLQRSDNPRRIFHLTRLRARRWQRFRGALRPFFLERAGPLRPSGERSPTTPTAPRTGSDHHAGV